MAAATVAAASAWWAANGLLPLCAPPFSSGGLTCHPPATTYGPSSGEVNVTKTMDQEHSEASKARSSLESEETKNGGVNQIVMRIIILVQQQQQLRLMRKDQMEREIENKLTGLRVAQTLPRVVMMLRQMLWRGKRMMAPPMMK